MKISLNWLNEYVDVNEFFEKPEELDKVLTAAGLEVEGMENQAQNFKNVVVGQVEVLDRHPDADKLTLCQVNVGGKENQQIICGAKNHKQGDKVAVALPGAVLPGDFAIKKSKIRGVESCGMMCSGSELGLADDTDGIIILPEDAPVGESFAEYKGLNDVVFDLSVTPNRADCLSHIGLAREIGCVLNREVKIPDPDLKAKGESTKSEIDLQLKDSELCPRYAGRMVRGVEVKESPAWLKSRLEAVGVNSINNIVDITNYVMLEMGQPLHAFDVRELRGQKIIIDRSKENEKFQSLDGSEYKLTGSELMIRDGERPVALAGVVGGLNSGVVDDTKDVFVESAHFVPQTVRKTSRAFGIDTDSGYRFSRGTDPEGVLRAMNRACELIVELAGGEISKDFHDEYPSPRKLEAIYIDQEVLEERLGYAADMSEFSDWMKRLGCSIQKSDSGFSVVPPAYRWDIEMDVDLVEEYARLNGYHNIPENLPSFGGEPTAHDSYYLNECRVSDLLSAEGYLQVVNYGFVGAKWQQEVLCQGDQTAVGLRVHQNPVEVVNPLNDETNVMRTSLLPGLVKNLLHNYRHGSESGRIFETGFAFEKTEENYAQYARLGLVAWGQKSTLWQKPEERSTVFDLKSTVENLLNKLNASGYQWRQVNPVPPHLHPGQTAGLFFQGKIIGYVGTLHPALKDQWKLRHDVALCEMDFEKLMAGQPKKPKIKGVSKFPSVERDLAFVVPDSVAVGDLVKELRKAGGQKLQSVEVFDVFRGGNLPEDHSSVAFRLVYQDLEGTLGEEALTAMQTKLIDSMDKKFSIQVR